MTQKRCWEVAARLRAELAGIEQERVELVETLKIIQAWDCLNPPNPELCADHPWLKKLVDDALVDVR